MNLGALKLVLSSLGETLSAAGAKAAAADTQNIATVLPGENHDDALLALEDLQRRLEKERGIVRDAYTEMLSAAGIDRSIFAHALQNLAADQLMQKEDIAIIAAAYIGAARKWRSKNAAIQSIQEKFSERAYLESKMELISASRKK